MPLSEDLKDKAKELFSRIPAKKAKRFLSIDFGAAFLKIVYLESGTEGLKLLVCDLQKILSADKNRHQTLEFIADFIKTNAVPEKEVYLTVGQADSVIIKSLKLPAMPEKEILAAAKLEVKEEIPFELEEALFDWQLLREYTEEAGLRKNEIIFIAARGHTIEKYLSIIKECGLTAVWISSGPFNYAQILKCSKKELPGCAVVDIGYRDSTLCIYSENKLVFSRRLSFSSDKITHSLTTTLISDIGKLELSYEEAENVKKTFGIPQETDQILEGNIQAMQLVSLIRPLLEELKGELKRSLDYFKTNFQKETPAVIYITGGGANLKNLDKYLQKELNIEVLSLPFPDCIDKEGLDEQKFAAFKNQIINAAAAPLAGAGAINLLPEEIRARKAELIEKVSLRLVAVALGAIFLFSLILLRLQIGDYQNRLKNAQLHLQTTSGVRAMKENVDSREALIDKIQKDRVPVEGLLKVISAIIPKEIILDELSLDTKRRNLILRGKALAGEGVADSVLTDFMQKIEASSFFREATLLSSQKAAEAQGFEIECELTR